MLYLDKLIMINFQKHDNLTLDFVNGVNVLHGKSRSGKSCIRRAIEWVGYNANIDAVRKQGTKKTTVTLVFSTGVEVSRIRSESINRYILKKDGEEKVFDSVGRSIPEEVQQAMQLSPITIDGTDLNINIANQITLPFLLDQSPSFRMKLFNKLTGNDLIDKMLVSLNKDILKYNKHIKTSEENIATYQKDLEEANLDKFQIDAIEKSVKSKLQKAKDLDEKIKKLDDIVVRTKSND
jgi:DNA repair exonuclease SbcCD ATPase subunit